MASGERGFSNGLVDNAAFCPRGDSPLIRVTLSLRTRTRFSTLQVPFAETDRGKRKIAGPGFDKTSGRTLNENSRNIPWIIFDQEITLGSAEIRA